MSSCRSLKRNEWFMDYIVDIPYYNTKWIKEKLKMSPVQYEGTEKVPMVQAFY